MKSNHTLNQEIVALRLSIRYWLRGAFTTFPLQYQFEDRSLDLIAYIPQ